jgi:hypothetical protein
MKTTVICLLVLTSQLCAAVPVAHVTGMDLVLPGFGTP